MNSKLAFRLSVALLVCFSLAISVSAAETPITFDGFTGAGFAPEPSAGQLDSDIWRVTGLSDGNGTFGGTHTTGDFARGSSTGSVSTGGVYAFTNVGSSGNTILGVQPTADDFTPGTITLKLTNTTGSTITDIYVAYKIWVRNDQGRANSLNFAYSTDDSTYISVPTLNYTTPEAADSSPSWKNVDRSITLSGVNLSPGGSLYLQWISDDVSGSGSRDEYGIDDIEVRVSSPTALTLGALRALPLIGTLHFVLPLLGLLALGGAALYRRRHTRVL